jgi:hypothetical protein
LREKVEEREKLFEQCEEKDDKKISFSVSKKSRDGNMKFL